MSRTMRLLFPLGGLHEGAGRQSQPPYTTPDCLNVRPVGAVERRRRGGSRPGIVKAYAEVLGGGEPVRMLGALNWLISGVDGVLTDHFLSPIGGSAMTGPWDLMEGVEPTLVSETFARVGAQSGTAMIRHVIADLDNAEPYSVTLGIGVPSGFDPDVSYADGSWFIVFLGMDDTTPFYTQDGLEVRMRINHLAGTYDRQYAVRVGGVLVKLDSTYGVSMLVTMPHELKVAWDPSTKQFSIYVDDVMVEGPLDFGDGVGPPSAFVGDRVGFGILTQGSGDDEAMIDFYRVTFSAAEIIEQERSFLVAAAAGWVYATDDVSHAMVVVTGAATIHVNASEQIQTAPFLQRLFIADCGDLRIASTVGQITATDHLALTADNPDWTALGIDMNSDRVMISSSSTPAADGLYEITALDATFAKLSPAPGDTTSCTCRIERSPKCYDAQTNTITAWVATAGLGDVPIGCPCIATYQGRIVLAGAPYAPHVFHMSRMGSYDDWDYGADSGDIGRAVAGTFGGSSEIGEPIKALIAWENDYLVIGCMSSLWVMRGNPAAGGIIDRLSGVVGVIDKNAYCLTPDGEIVFLSRHGLYVLPPGGQSPPEPVSADKLPDRLRDVSAEEYAVSMVFDAAENGIHLWLTPSDYLGTYHWWIDWRTKTFWPVTYAEGHEPMVGHAFYSVASDRSGTLMGCRDGYVRRSDRMVGMDDGTAFASHALIGPIALGGENVNGIVNELIPILGDPSGPVAWSLLAGNTPEEAQANAVRNTGTFIAGYGKSTRPRQRCSTFFIKVAAAGETPWALERILARIQAAGKVRLV